MVNALQIVGNKKPSGQLREYDRLVKQLGLTPSTQEQSSHLFKKMTMRAMLKAKGHGVDLNELISAARSLGNSRRSLPYKTHARQGLVFAAMRSLTRQERIAINALAGTRPSVKNQQGQLQPAMPLAGNWIGQLDRMRMSKEIEPAEKAQ